MKKIFAGILLLFGILSVGSASAFEVKFGEEVYVTEQTGGDLYVAGGLIHVNAPVYGDLVVAGGQLDVVSDVKDDILIAGGEVMISGTVGDDIRAAGGSIHLNSQVNGDVVVGAGDLRIGKNAFINGTLVVGAGRVFLDGVVQGDVKIAGGELVLNGTIYGQADLQIGSFKNPAGTGTIEGILRYKADEKISELEAITQGQVIFEKTFIKQEVKESFFTFLTSYFMIKIFWTFVFAGVFYFCFEKFFLRIGSTLRKHIGKSFLYGLLTIAATPVIILLLFITLVGIPFALLFLFSYIFLFVFLSLINTMVVSALVIGEYKIKNIYKKLALLFAFSIIFILINGISLIAGFFTIGAITIRKIAFFSKQKK